MGQFANISKNSKLFFKRSQMFLGAKHFNPIFKLDNVPFRIVTKNTLKKSIKIKRLAQKLS